MGGQLLVSKGGSFLPGAEDSGSLFRRLSSAETVLGEGVTVKPVCQAGKKFAGKIRAAKLVPHDSRQRCARLGRAAGGELEQVQFLTSHLPANITRRDPGCTQHISSAVNDRMGSEQKT